MAEGEDMAATEEGIARGEFSGGILHNFIVTLFTPKCNLCNLDYNLGASPLNSLNLIDKIPSGATPTALSFGQSYLPYKPGHKRRRGIRDTH